MAKITCDHCGAEMDFAPLYYREGDLEITCMRCGNCATEYVSAVTDSALREDIERYKRMAKMMAARKMPERFIRREEASRPECAAKQGAERTVSGRINDCALPDGQVRFFALFRREEVKSTHGESKRHHS